MSVDLELRSLELTYGQRAAVSDLSLKVQAGSFFCLLGPSGCGKSTTLSAIAGFLLPTRGHVLVDARDVTNTAPRDRKVGVVFQSYALFPHMTAAANIGYGLKLLRRPKAEIARAVDDLLHLVRLDGKGDRYPRQLSGGEQQRVAIARALAIEPKLLLLDEPLSNLDARLREEMGAELKRIQRETGVTTVLVTHDQEEAFGIADTVGVMNAGRLEQVGTPTEVYRTPKTSFVAGFIGRGNRLAVSGAPSALNLGPHRLVSQDVGPPGFEKGILFLRPEELKLGPSASEVNAIPGRVVEVVYSGSTVNVRARTDVGDMLVCELANRMAALPLGSDVFVQWPAHAGVVLPHE